MGNMGNPHIKEACSSLIVWHCWWLLPCLRPLKLMSEFSTGALRSCSRSAATLFALAEQSNKTSEQQQQQQKGKKNRSRPIVTHPLRIVYRHSRRYPTTILLIRIQQQRQQRPTTTHTLQNIDEKKHFFFPSKDIDIFGCYCQKLSLESWNKRNVDVAFKCCWIDSIS